MTQDIVRIEGTASDTLTQGSREQCALLSLGKKVTSVNSNLHPPWALKKKKSRVGRSPVFVPVSPGCLSV